MALNGSPPISIGKATARGLAAAHWPRNTRAMIRQFTATALALSLLATTANAGPPSAGTGVAWEIVEGLTTEIGPRLLVIAAHEAGVMAGN